MTALSTLVTHHVTNSRVTRRVDASSLLTAVSFTMSDRRKAASKIETLAAYKRVREGGDRAWKVRRSFMPARRVLALTTRLQPEEDDDLYDEVDENQYKSIVKGRLQRDDFIVDDGVDGYADNGMDDWGDNEGLESEEEKPKGKDLL